MSRRDVFHDAAKRALENDGWTITDDPYTVPYGATIVEIDLGAERLIAAEKDGEKIAVEIKRFVGHSALAEFHMALGQYLNYRIAIREHEPGRALYLAVPLEAFESSFRQVVVQRTLEEYCAVGKYLPALHFPVVPRRASSGHHVDNLPSIVVLRAYFSGELTY